MRSNPITYALSARGAHWAACLLGVSIYLSGCASGVEPPKPAELGPNAALIGVRLAWTAKIGEVKFPLDVTVSGNAITVAGTDGSVAAIDARTGGDIWQIGRAHV